MLRAGARRTQRDARDECDRGQGAENNLKSIDVAFPLGGFICVTGVSGSGKSTLVNEVLLKAASARFSAPRIARRTTASTVSARSSASSRSTSRPSAARAPIRPRTPASSMTSALFAASKEAKIRGYEPGRFSFNVKGGRCEACQGQGVSRIEMHFLPDVFVTCETCKGSRYNRETLEITYRHKTISDVLDMTVEEAVKFFDAHPKILRMLQCLHDVGLDYVQLGQPPRRSPGRGATNQTRQRTGQHGREHDQPAHSVCIG